MGSERRLANVRIALENYQELSQDGFSPEQIISLLAIGENIGNVYLRQLHNPQNQAQIGEAIGEIKRKDETLSRPSVTQYIVLRTLVPGLEAQSQHYLANGNMPLFVLSFDQMTGVKRAMETLSQAGEVLTGGLEERLERDLAISEIMLVDQVSKLDLPIYETSRQRLLTELRQDALENSELLKIDESGFRLLDALLLRAQSPVLEQDGHFPLTTFNPPDFAIQGARFGVTAYKEIYPFTF